MSCHVANLDFRVGHWSRWLEGCPCHNDLLINCRSHRERGVALMRAGVVAGHCPWAGRRGTELVLGKLREMVQELRSTCTESLVLVRSQLSQEELSGLASDAAAMGAEVSSELEVKCGSMWYEVPHILVGFLGEDVGHSISEVNACIKKSICALRPWPGQRHLRRRWVF